MTDVSLRDYIERQLVAQMEILRTRLDAADQAVQRASEQLTIRLEHSNGLIDQMRQQNGDMARKVEVLALRERLEALERARAGIQPLAAIGMVILAACVSALVAYLTKTVV